MFTSCVHGNDSCSDEEECDSLDADTMELEALDLYEPMPIPESADELFDDFFYSFIEDEEFRTERCKAELQNQSILMKEAYVVVYERDDDLAMRKDTTIDNAVLEWIDWHGDEVQHYQFGREADGRWFLTDIEPEQIEDLPNGTFYSFLSDFFTDDEFRMEATRLPLTFIVEPQGDEDEGIETSLDESEWEELYNQLPDFSTSMVCLDYGQTAISQNRKILLLEGLSSGLEMKLIFNNVGGEWKLIKIES